MAKLFAEKLQILEKEINEIKGKVSVVAINETVAKLEKEVEELKVKINQIITEITPILTSHATAINALLGKNITNK